MTGSDTLPNRTGGALRIRDALFALDDAVRRMGGTLANADFVEASDLRELLPTLLAAARSA